MNKRLVLKLNIFAFLYSLVLIIQTLLMINAYRLERITHWLDFRINTLFMLVIFIFSSVVFFILTIKFLSSVKSRYFLVLLWIPYYFALYKLSFILMPITNPGDKASPVTGLLLMVIYFLFPFYIVLINYFSGIIADVKLRKTNQST